MVPHILWLYERTSDEWLPALAARFHQGTQPPMNEWLDSHGVRFAQRWRYPARVFPPTGDARDVAASEYWLAQHGTTWGQQPRGAFATDERMGAVKVDPRQATETCTMVELARISYILGAIAGDPVYTNRCEDVIPSPPKTSGIQGGKAGKSALYSNRSTLATRSRHGQDTPGF